ncbi:response regulator [Blastopirellula sp. JC732]|uniref:Response regulator n=1 Tax=Blastopirellula sediminis TaxID=2894196 RepID=A0A9X1MJC0_9BACT|nr:response regulator [Blastopirellula sediminis]MCC9609080.1 response regulator [Blastopirellula sediminis]MCC9628143.1 response regulator [Blastopirellula sediminis]
MSIVTYFIQQCPTCGRRLQVRINDLGRNVSCQHCHAEFTASDPSMSSSQPISALDSVEMALRKAEAFLSARTHHATM